MAALYMIASINETDLSIYLSITVLWISYIKISHTLIQTPVEQYLSLAQGFSNLSWSIPYLTHPIQVCSNELMS